MFVGMFSMTETIIIVVYVLFVLFVLVMVAWKYRNSTTPIVHVHTVLGTSYLHVYTTLGKGLAPPIDLGEGLTTNSSPQNHGGGISNHMTAIRG